MTVLIRVFVVALLITRLLSASAPPVAGQGRGQTPGPLPPDQTNDPFPTPIPATEGAIKVGVTEFASLPDIDGVAARMMQLVNEPGSRRLFVNDMRGPLYSVSYDGKTVKQYLDINAPEWEMPVQSMGRERGFQSFAFHPQFSQAGTPGYGKFYTYADTTNMLPQPDFLRAESGTNASPTGSASAIARSLKEGLSNPVNYTHDTVLFEWTAKTPGAATYDGGPPRELFRMRQPFANHNAGHMAFNPNSAPGSPDFGLLYIGVADGGSGGDPLNMSQNLGSAFGKVFRINPLGNNSGNKKYGIPAGNPFIHVPGALPEIYAYGVRNPQRFAWDAKNGNLFLSDIGQNIVEEVSLVTPGANLGWNIWEGSFRYISRQAVSMENRRGDSKVTFPLVEYGQLDPLLQPNSAANGLIVYRGDQIPQIANLVLFTDMPSGEIFYFSADNLPNGGQDPIRRIIFRHNGTEKTMLQLIQDKNTAQGKKLATRSDLRLATGPNNQVLLLNKGDGTIRRLLP
jgi:glucose/arabinose dehydrogenase